MPAGLPMLVRRAYRFWDFPLAPPMTTPMTNAYTPRTVL